MRTLFVGLVWSIPTWIGGNPYPTIGSIPLPAGYHRVVEGEGTFGAWLRNVPLKKETTVYLYNGKPKENQDAQFAVLDVPVGKEDLQQCADAVMRLRAEYLYSRSDNIEFYTETGRKLNFTQWAADHGGAVYPPCVFPNSTRAAFDRYLREVFMYCSTRTLARQLGRASLGKVEPGDVLIRAGSPGHAMLVVDVAEDNHGHRTYLLAQSYMPAQDIHIVKNPGDNLGPWYWADSSLGRVVTPEYIFKTNELRKWIK
jgi:Domain of unknown function (4846)